MRTRRAILERWRLTTLLRLGAATVAAMSMFWTWQLAMNAGSGGIVPIGSLALAAVTIMGCMAGVSVLVERAVASRVAMICDGVQQLAQGCYTPSSQPQPADALGQAADSLSEAAAKLAQLEHARARFIASVSHELRTPLTVIRSAVFTSLRSEQDALLGRRLRSIDAEAARLQSQIDDLMAAASIQAGQLTIRLERRELAPVMITLLERFRTMASARGVELELHDFLACAVEVELDELRLGQVIGNLVVNAITHAQPGSTVAVALRDTDACALVEVSNVGRPIPVEERSQLFEPFGQGAVRTGRVGLGLSVARDIARMHGGDVRLAASGGRTTFELSLPASTAPHEHSSGSATRLLPSARGLAGAGVGA